MASPLYWPGAYYFYPIGNTSATCLTRDLPPEEQANIFLLGCGDPKNILYTIFCEPHHFGRKLDFTCCDMEPAVLARNVLLFSLIADQQKYATIWNIFYHMYLDKDSHSVLVDQCKKLVGLSENFRKWHASPYGSFIRMCTEYTLHELQRHWQSYIDMQHLPSKRLKMIRNAFNKIFPLDSPDVITIHLTPARSSGPLFEIAIRAASTHLAEYRKSGVLFSNQDQITAATLINPTFAYSLAGEGCNVHYGTDPLVPFHFAALFGNSKKPISTTAIVEFAKCQFNDWCTAFHKSISLPASESSPPVIRFFLGEATAVCRVLQSFTRTSMLKPNIPVAQWKSQLIELSKDEYLAQGGAPTAFNVIDSSNLDDHIGLLNVIISAVPLLSISSPSGVLYTESLLSYTGDATKEFTERLYGDITTISLLLGICPIDYLSGFTTRSNFHEIMMKNCSNRADSQFHQVSTWKSPTGGGTALGTQQRLLFDSYQLGTLLYDIYHQMFEQEDALSFWTLNKDHLEKSISTANIIFYVRETFVLFLKFIRERLNVSNERWLGAMERFYSLHKADKSMPMDTNNANDVYAHMHQHGLYTSPQHHPPIPSIGRFSGWSEIPIVVRVVTTIPREKLAIFEGPNTPPLQCEIRGKWSQHIFTSVHVVYGRATAMGTKSKPSVLIEEDPDGPRGNSPLVASFIVPARHLTSVEPPEILKVCFSVRSSFGTVMEFIPKLGADLIVSEANLMDETSVHVMPESKLPLRYPQPPLSTTSGQIGEVGATVVELDEECELVASLTSRISVTDEEVKRLFGSGTTPDIKQTSPCAMRISIANRVQDVVYPWPVIGSQYKLRLARKSLYIEIVVPVFTPLKPDGMKLNMFPVMGSDGVFNPWNIHHVNLSRLPVLNTKLPSENIYKWLNPHVGSAMSVREKSLRKKHEEDTLMFVKDTLHTIFVRSAGIQGGPARQVFALRDKATTECDTILFINGLRFDLALHTMVCDAYLLPLTPMLMLKIWDPFYKLVAKDAMTNVTTYKGEMEAWKQLLPAFVERCRMWKHSENCEYVSQGRVPLSEELHEDPICSCGKGKDSGDMLKVASWSAFAPYVTRIALSPLFAVTYLEPIVRDPAARRCYVCRRKGNPKLMMCTQCKKVRYCSKECQRKNWKAHKTRCKA